MKKISERKKKWIERTVANDRSYKRFLYNRIYIFAFLVLLQMLAFGAIWYLFAYNSRIAVSVQAVLGALALIFALVIASEDVRPSVKIQWVLIILILPVFGVPFYLLCGEGRPTKGMSKKLERAKKQNDEVIEGRYGAPNIPQKGVQKYLQAEGYPPFEGGGITYFSSGEALFPAMMEEMEKAKEFILLEYFIIAHGKVWGDMLALLLKKAEEGVPIRILYDDFGCMTTLPPSYDKYLSSLHGNIRAHRFNPAIPVFAVRMNNRDHRKILVVDGKVAFTGGVNLADEYAGEKERFGYWKDTGVRVEGNAVRSFTRMFFNLWNAFFEEKEELNAYLPPLKSQKGKGTVVPYDDSPLDKKRVGEWVYLDMIGRAQDYLYIFTPYLLLDDALKNALRQASERGVDVRIVVPGIPDKKGVYRLTRANYATLIKAGVKIYEYTPGFIHAKSIVCDDCRAVVGTINFDYRSLYMHFENAVYFENCEAVLAVKRDAEETFALSKLCAVEDCKRTLFGRMLDGFLKIFEPLM